MILLELILTIQSIFSGKLLLAGCLKVGQLIVLLSAHFSSNLCLVVGYVAFLNRTVSFPCLIN